MRVHHIALVIGDCLWQRVRMLKELASAPHKLCNIINQRLIKRRWNQFDDGTSNKNTHINRSLSQSIYVHFVHWPFDHLSIIMIQNETLKCDAVFLFFLIDCFAAPRTAISTNDTGNWERPEFMYVRALFPMDNRYDFEMLTKNSVDRLTDWWINGISTISTVQIQFYCFCFLELQFWNYVSVSKDGEPHLWSHFTYKILRIWFY